MQNILFNQGGFLQSTPALEKINMGILNSWHVEYFQDRNREEPNNLG